MDNTIDNTFESANRVYDANGIAPTVNTCGGGGRQPHIVEVKKLDVNELEFINNGTGKHQSNIVYDSDGLSPCICAGMGVKQQPTMTIEQQIVAMRGRNPENPSDRTPGAHLEQRLEPNEQGICNCLTSVSKDNMVLEKKSIKIRQATKDGFIDCEIGGGSGFRLPIIRDTQGKSDKQRSDKSDTDNGEYP